MGPGRRTLVLVLAVVVPCVALAHNLPPRITDRAITLLDYGQLGTTHMLGGYDHLLFVRGITLLYDRVRDVVKAVTLFTVGHSTTLLLATLTAIDVSAEAGQLCALTAFLTCVYFIRTRGRLDRLRPPAEPRLGTPVRDSRSTSPPCSSSSASARRS